MNQLIISAQDSTEYRIQTVEFPSLYFKQLLQRVSCEGEGIFVQLKVAVDNIEKSLPPEFHASHKIEVRNKRLKPFLKEILDLKEGTPQEFDPGLKIRLHRLCEIVKDTLENDGSILLLHR